VRSAEGGAGRVPTVDRFPGLHLPDWFQTLGRGAWMMVAGLVGQGREILAQVTAGLEETGSLPGMVELDATQSRPWSMGCCRGWGR
jgi:hypothetical protein